MESIAQHTSERRSKVLSNADIKAIIYAISEHQLNCRFEGVSRVASAWMDDFCLIVFSEIDRLGFDTENIVSELSKFTIGRFYGTDFNPYNGDSYRFPTALTDASPVTTWAQANALYPIPNKSSFPSINYTYGYRHIALAALAEVANRPNGSAAYNWLKTNLTCSVTMDDDPTWAISPLIARGKRYHGFRYEPQQ